MTFIKEFEPGKEKVFHISFPYIMALLRSMLIPGGNRTGKDLLLEIILLLFIQETQTVFSEYTFYNLRISFQKGLGRISKLEVR
jgi:hypothetical protein